MVNYVICSQCGKRVSNYAGVELLVRAWVECPECIEKQPDEEILQAELDDLKSQVKAAVEAIRETGNDATCLTACKILEKHGLIEEDK